MAGHKLSDLTRKDKIQLMLLVAKRLEEKDQVIRSKFDSAFCERVRASGLLSGEDSKIRDSLAKIEKYIKKHGITSKTIFEDGEDTGERTARRAMIGERKRFLK
jgi:hypothetical protein